MAAESQQKAGPLKGANQLGARISRSRYLNQGTKITAAQQEHGKRLNMAVRFCRPMQDLFERCHRDFEYENAGGAKIHSQIMKEAISGTYPRLVLDYSKILVSKGSLPMAAVPYATSLSPETVQFFWTNSSTAATTKERQSDQTIIVAYCPALHRAFYTIGAGRRFSGYANLAVPGFSGQDVHTWFSFMADDRPQAAKSVYTGKVTVL